MRRQAFCPPPGEIDRAHPHAPASRSPKGKRAAKEKNIGIMSRYRSHLRHLRHLRMTSWSALSATSPNTPRMNSWTRRTFRDTPILRAFSPPPYRLPGLPLLSNGHYSSYDGTLPKPRIVSQSEWLGLPGPLDAEVAVELSFRPCALQQFINSSDVREDFP